MTDLIPSDMTFDDVRNILSNPQNLDYHRVLANILEGTTALDEVKKYVNTERLVKEFPKIRNHMTHGEMDESTRLYWEQEISKLAKELGMDDQRIPTSEATGKKSSAQMQEEGKSKEKTKETEQEMAVRKEKQRRDLGQQLSRMRQKKEVSRNQLAQNTTLELKDIAEIEKGRKELTYDVLNAYGRGLNMELRLDFQEKHSDKEGDLLHQVHQLIEDVMQTGNLTGKEKTHCQITLHQLAEDGLYQKRFSTVIDLLEYMETITKDFSIRDESPDPEVFSNEALFGLLSNMIDSLELTDMAYDEKLKSITQEALKRYHDVEEEKEASEDNES
ncbi:MAG: multiprotein-bridging factor 1 family protein [bacterium]